jgi:hypothetical protein
MRLNAPRRPTARRRTHLVMPHERHSGFTSLSAPLPSKLRLLQATSLQHGLDDRGTILMPERGHGYKGMGEAKSRDERGDGDPMDTMLST